MNNENNKDELMNTNNDVRDLVECFRAQLQINGQTQDKINEMSTELHNISARTDKLENETTITKAQSNKIQRFGATRIHELLGASDSRDYVIYSRTFYGHLWHDFKKRFGVSYYGDIRKVDYDEAFNFIEAWFPDEGLEGLKAMIDRRNSILAA